MNVSDIGKDLLILPIFTGTDKRNYLKRLSKLDVTVICDQNRYLATLTSVPYYSQCWRFDTRINKLKYQITYKKISN